MDMKKQKTDASARLCVGVDIGTTDLKGVLLDPDAGSTVGVYSTPNAFRTEPDMPGARLQNPEGICSGVKELLDTLIDRYPGIRCIGFTGQMHGILYVGENCRALSPLYTWQDGRAGIGSPSALEEIRRLSGYALSAGYGLATHYHEMRRGTVPQGAKKLCTVMDYVPAFLCGRPEPLMHVSDAASLGFWQNASARFDADAMARCGMDPSVLPQVTAGYDVIGTYRGIPVSVAIGDNQASFFGSVREPGRSVLVNFGTGSQVSLVCGRESAQDMSGEIECRPYIGGEYLMCGSALCGGRAYALLENFFRSYIRAAGGADAEQYEVLNRLARRGLDSGTVLDVRTTFSGTRSDADMRGQIAGIGTDNFTPEALAAGVLCGMAEEVHGMYKQILREGISVLIGSGNAVRKNPVLREVLTRVFGMPLYITAHTEEAAYGAAMFAALATGTVGSFDELKCFIRYDGAEE